MTVDPAIMAARARVAAAKLRLDASVSHAKVRLSPRSLASDAVETATDKAAQVAQTGIQVARDRPGWTVAIVGAVGLALAHRPIIGWARSLSRSSGETTDDDASLNTQPGTDPKHSRI